MDEAHSLGIDQLLAREWRIQLSNNAIYCCEPACPCDTGDDVYVILHQPKCGFTTSYIHDAIDRHREMVRASQRETGEVTYRNG